MGVRDSFSEHVKCSEFFEQQFGKVMAHVSSLIGKLESNANLSSSVTVELRKQIGLSPDWVKANYGGFRVSFVGLFTNMPKNSLGVVEKLRGSLVSSLDAVEGQDVTAVFVLVKNVDPSKSMVVAMPYAYLTNDQSFMNADIRKRFKDARFMVDEYAAGLAEEISRLDEELNFKIRLLRSFHREGIVDV